MGFVRRAVIYATAKSLRERGHHRNSDTRALYIEFFSRFLRFGSIDRVLRSVSRWQIRDKFRVMSYRILIYFYSIAIYACLVGRNFILHTHTHTYTQIHILFIIKYSTISSMWLDLEIKNAYLFNFDHKKLNNFNALRISICRN